MAMVSTQAVRSTPPKAVVSGWDVAQYPWLLVDQVRISDAGGAHATLTALLIVVALAAVVVVPALIYLPWLT